MGSCRSGHLECYGDLSPLLGRSILARCTFALHKDDVVHLNIIERKGLPGLRRVEGERPTRSRSLRQRCAHSLRQFVPIARSAIVNRLVRLHEFHDAATSVGP